MPFDFSDLSPLDALAAQGRLLNKRLTQNGRSSANSPPPGTGVLDDSVFPKFGVSDTFENREFRGYEKRNRVPEKRRGGGSESPQSPVDSLSLATLSLLAIPQNPSATSASVPPTPSNGTVDLLRSDSQASSFLSLSTSSEGSETPTERLLTSRIYQPPQKAEPPRLRPIIKTQQLARSYSPTNSPNSGDDQMTPVDLPPAPRPYTPQLSNALDRPRLPSLQTKVYPSKRTPSINFSRPYSSRSSAFSDASSAHEVDYFSGPRTLSPADDHLSIPHRSSGSESSSPGIPDEDLRKLPRGRRKSRPLDTGVFFHSKSIKAAGSGYRWPQTPVTPTQESDRDSELKRASSPAEDPMPRINHLSTSTTFSVYSTGTSFVDVPPPPPIPRPATSGSLSQSPRPDTRPPRQARSVSQEVRRPSTSPRPISHGSPQAPFAQQSHPREFSSPTQVLNPSRSRSTTMSHLHPFPPMDDQVDQDDHVTLGIKYHQQDLLPQATHHFQLAAESGEPTGMLFYSLSLRHGWGCAANPEKAVQWLHSAAETRFSTSR